MAGADRPSCMPDEDAGVVRDQRGERLPELYGRLAAAIRVRWRGADAEDVVQDAFLRLSLAETRAEVLDPGAFLYVTALNLIRDRARAEVTRGMLLVDTRALEQIVSDDPSTDQILAAREQLAIVDAAIAELPFSARTAFVMHRLENLPQAEIAEALSISVSMVEKHVRRALTHCRDRLAEADGTAVHRGRQRSD
ncbi:sigma-70 family RNA polymerase sigma factor [Sphingomonas sp. G-3-2-10]|uniref:RNA polymerase sigma factor n=1 Tax=Sphingomonas sp. G-3-2-10 TaxID=2728838 RepID=UPI001469F705|nr:sigma-70 family RNA polymerase sigma factor [Sphingomonas sp. G-3-2-10]NML07799.1 sigma-70 family RNA polymerase sigma factor [Sphingomonas sp. G-3-2-10]